MDIKSIVAEQKKKLNQELQKTELAYGEIIFYNGNCQLLSQSPARFELIVTDESGEMNEYVLNIIDEEVIFPFSEEKSREWDRMSYACLLQIENELQILDPKANPEHKKYTREGMIRRVLKERQQKAFKAKYTIKWGSNIYGDHILTNENGIKYRVFLRDFENETGWSDSMDSKLNKLGTTKHIMFAFNQLKERKSLYSRLSKKFPFLEIYCDPLNDYHITWHYPGKLPVEEQLLISKYFKDASFIPAEKEKEFIGFIEAAEDLQMIKIRPEVREKVERAWDESLLLELKNSWTPDFSKLNINLYPYQKEGIEFVIFKKAAIIADEMGLGKTIQAIGAAIVKKEIFDFKKTLIVCPASLKAQWKNEIEKFSDEKAVVVQGLPYEREKQYREKDAFFYIVNYETVLRDQVALNKAGFDFLILDEAQRAKNYETKTANSLKSLNPKHKLIITGTPIENRLIDIYSIMGILDPHFLGPLWEFSYKHCLFDPERHDKINGYYNLQSLNKKLTKILLRREKKKVIDQLPNIQQMHVRVNLSPLQADYHASFASGIAQILVKKFLTPYDLQKLQLLLANMRMVCDSTYLIDGETNESPKLEELEYLLLEKLDLKNQNRKIIIFSEWIKVHKLIGRMLRANGIGFVELSGKIPVKARGELIRKFEQNHQYKIFLSTEAGGSGLNLQVADTIINFELPWNPAKKNQRIGRIDRLGQKSKNLTIVNFVTRQSIEERIAAGLIVKQNLFDGVLGNNAMTNFVDFSTKGRSQFIQQLEEFINETENAPPPEDFEKEEVAEKEAAVSPVAEQEQLQTVPESAPEESGQTINLEENDKDDETAGTEPGETIAAGPAPKTKTEQMEEVMNNGMQFLAGMFKMATGKDMGAENQKIEIDKETGEVVMRFKMPV